MVVFSVLQMYRGEKSIVVACMLALLVVVRVVGTCCRLCSILDQWLS